MCSRSAVLDYKGICAQDGYQMLIDLFVSKVKEKMLKPFELNRWVEQMNRKFNKCIYLAKQF